MTESSSVVVWGCWGPGGPTHKGAQENFWRMVAVFAGRVVVMVGGVDIYATAHQIVPFK